eukprot:scaffold1074_cov409-Prasinococcus_capsulatus_cf.AAC.28
MRWGPSCPLQSPQYDAAKAFGSARHYKHRGRDEIQSPPPLYMPVSSTTLLFANRGSQTQDKSHAQDGQHPSRDSGKKILRNAGSVGFEGGDAPEDAREQAHAQLHVDPKAETLRLQEKLRDLQKEYQIQHAPPPPTASRLPEGWAQYHDPATGRPFYHNKKTGVSVWELPTPTSTGGRQTGSTARVEEPVSKKIFTFDSEGEGSPGISASTDPVGPSRDESDTLSKTEAHSQRTVTLTNVQASSKPEGAPTSVGKGLDIEQTRTSANSQSESSEAQLAEDPKVAVEEPNTDGHTQRVGRLSGRPGEVGEPSDEGQLMELSADREANLQSENDIQATADVAQLVEDPEASEQEPNASTNAAHVGGLSGRPDGAGEPSGQGQPMEVYADGEANSQSENSIATTKDVAASPLEELKSISQNEVVVGESYFIGGEAEENPPLSDTIESRLNQAGTHDSKGQHGSSSDPYIFDEANGQPEHQNMEDSMKDILTEPAIPLENSKGEERSTARDSDSSGQVKRGDGTDAPQVHVVSASAQVHYPGEDRDEEDNSAGEGV